MLTIVPVPYIQSPFHQDVLSQTASVADHPVDSVVGPDNEGIPLLMAVDPMDLEDDP